MPYVPPGGLSRPRNTLGTGNRRARMQYRARDLEREQHERALALADLVVDTTKSTGDEMLGALRGGLSMASGGVGGRPGAYQRTPYAAAAAGYDRGIDTLPGGSERVAAQRDSRQRAKDAGVSELGLLATELASPDPLGPLGKGIGSLGPAAKGIGGLATMFPVTARQLAHTPKYAYRMPMRFRYGAETAGLPDNVQRALQIAQSRRAKIKEAFSNPEAVEQGMAWGNQEPLYDWLYENLPENLANERWQLWNSLRGIESPMSSVNPEMRRALYGMNAHSAGLGLGALAYPARRLGDRAADTWGAIGSASAFAPQALNRAVAQNAARAGRPMIGTGATSALGGEPELDMLHPFLDTGPFKTPQYASASHGNMFAVPTDRRDARIKFMEKGDSRWESGSGITPAEEEASYLFTHDLAKELGVEPFQAMATPWVHFADEVTTAAETADSRASILQLNDIISELSQRAGLSENDTMRGIFVDGRLPIAGVRDMRDLPSVSRSAAAKWNSPEATLNAVPYDDYIHARNQLKGELENAMISHYSEQQLKDMGAEALLSGDGKLGYLLIPRDNGQKELAGLFSLHGAGDDMRGIGMKALEDGVQRGATFLEVYSRNFRPAARAKEKPNRFFQQPRSYTEAGAAERSAEQGGRWPWAPDIVREDAVAAGKTPEEAQRMVDVIEHNMGKPDYVTMDLAGGDPRLQRMYGQESQGTWDAQKNAWLIENAHKELPKYRKRIRALDAGGLSTAKANQLRDTLRKQLDLKKERKVAAAKRKREQAKKKRAKAKGAGGLSK